MDLTGSQYGQLAGVCEHGKKIWVPYKGAISLPSRGIILQEF
jgi:hypothetical protein